jgi:hypothetical protein
MSNLPPEVLTEVFNHLSRESKQQCLLVCKPWYVVALYLLNRSIVIKNSNDATILLGKIFQQNGFIDGNDVHHMSFQSKYNSNDFINRAVFIRILFSCKNLRTLDFTNENNSHRYLQYLDQYKNTVPLNSLQAIYAPYSCSQYYITLTHHYRGRMNQLSLQIYNKSFKETPGIDGFSSYLNHFSFLKTLNLRFKRRVFLHNLLRACPLLETLQLFNFDNDNPLEIFNNNEPNERSTNQEITNSKLKFLIITSSMVNQELFEYLLDRTSQLYQLSISGRCSNPTIFNEAFSAFVNYNRTFSIKHLTFDEHVSVSQELITGLNASFSHLAKIEFAKCNFSKVIDQHQNLKLDFSSLDIHYLFIDFTDLLINRPGINAVSLEIKQNSNHNIKYFQRTSKWKANNMFIKKTNKHYISNSASEKRIISRHLSILKIDTNTLHCLRLNCNNSFKQIITLN